VGAGICKHAPADMTDSEHKFTFLMIGATLLESASREPEHHLCRMSGTCEQLMSESGAPENELQPSVGADELAKQGLHRIARFVPLGVLVSALIWPVSVAQQGPLMAALELRGMSRPMVELWLHSTICYFCCAGIYYVTTLDMLGPLASAVCCTAKVIVAPVVYWYVFFWCQQDCVSLFVLVVLILLFSLFQLIGNGTLIAWGMYWGGSGNSQEKESICSRLMYVLLQMGWSGVVTMAFVIMSLVVFLHVLALLPPLPRLALSIIYPEIARCIMLKGFKQACTNVSLGERLHIHRIALLLTEIVGEMLAKQSAYIGGDLPNVALVLICQAANEIVVLWAGQTLVIPVRVGWKRLSARRSGEGAAATQPSKNDGDGQDLVQSAAEILKQELVVLSAVKYDVRNSVEYLAHSAVVMGLIVMGADAQLMMKAWLVGIFVEIASDFIGTQCRRCLHADGLGFYRFDWSKSLVALAVLFTTNMANMCCMHSLLVMRWTCPLSSAS